MGIHEDCGGDEYEMALGTVTGLRSFDVSDDGYLTSVSWGSFKWQPGVNTAHCDNVSERLRRRINHAFVKPRYDVTRNPDDGSLSFTRAVPTPQPYKELTGRCGDDSHGCGFWAYHDGSRYPGGEITGVIWGWGKTTIGTKGFRSDFAEVKALHIGTGSMSRSRIISGYALVILYVIAVYFFSTTGPAWVHIVMPVLGASVGVASGCCTGYVLSQYKRVRAAPRGDVIARLRETYPDVRMYTSYRKMLRDWPPSYKKDHVA